MSSVDDNLSKVIERDPQLEFLRPLIALAKRLLKPERITVFGSRARGDARRHSDVDLAFDLAKKETNNWAEFTAAANEDLPTLLDLDLVRMDQASLNIKQAVTREGIAIYERKDLAQPG